MPKFSVITPVYNHNKKRLLDTWRCINSVRSQSFRDFEHILIDQTENEELELSFGDLDEEVLVRQPHLERLFALRMGFEEAKGDWFCLLDSDDIYLPHYLETVNQMIEENPEYKMFNFGSVHIHKDGKVTVRDAFKPLLKEDVGHAEFNGGNIVNGTFVWHRSLWEELGDWPKIEKLWNPWDFSIAFQEEFPEQKKYFMVDHEDEPEKIAKELGNPWGNDHALFYRYTREYRSLAVDKHLYGVYHK